MRRRPRWAFRVKTACEFDSRHANELRSKREKKNKQRKKKIKSHSPFLHNARSKKKERTSFRVRNWVAWWMAWSPISRKSFDTANRFPVGRRIRHCVCSIAHSLVGTQSDTHYDSTVWNCCCFFFCLPKTVRTAVSLSRLPATFSDTQV